MQVGKDDYLEDELAPGDIVISVGKIFQAITASTDIPSSNSAALRLSLYLRTTAIRQAREKELTGWILTSNGNRADLDRLVAEAGADGVTIIKLTEAASVRACRGAGPKGCSAAGVRGRDQAALVWTLSADRQRSRGRPMNDVEIRCAVECRQDETRSGPGRLVGRILKYGERAIDRPELFERGSLTWPADGVVLTRQHARAAPIMRVQPTLIGDELRIDQALPDTVAGSDAATEIRSGLLRGLSVSFQAQRQAFEGGVRLIQSAAMTAVGLVDSPSYDAPVEVRARGHERRHRRAWL